MTVGKGQVIPSGTSIARATWKDAWGRAWYQPHQIIIPRCTSNSTTAQELYDDNNI